MAIGPLPDLDILDMATLKDMVIRQHAQISSHDTEIERLRLIIAKLRRMQFGRKSEKIQKEIEQLELQLEVWRPSARRSGSRPKRRWRRQMRRYLRKRCANRPGVLCRIIFPVK